MSSVERKAIEVLAERGWCKGSYIDLENRVCLVGALALAVGDHDAAYDRVLGVANELFPDRLSVIIPSFNDHPDTTIDDVLLVLEKAAIKAEEAS